MPRRNISFSIVESARGAPQEHDALLLTWTDWCGLSRQEVEATEPLPSLRALLSFMWYLVYQHPWQVWLAAQVVQESQMVGVQQRTVPALLHKYGFRRGAKEIHTPATELAVAIRARKVSPVELVDAVLARIEALNPRLNAFLTVDVEGARQAARAAEAAVLRGETLGLLHGILVSIKDLEPTAGLRCTYGRNVPCAAAARPVRQAWYNQ